MDKLLRKKATNFGLYMGLTLALITMLCYAFDLSMFASLWLLLINFLIILGFGIVSGASAKKVMNGFPKFKDVFTSYTITMALGLLISTIVGIILFNIIDPTAAETVKEISLEQSEKLMRQFGAPESEIEKAMVKAEENDPFSLSTQIMNYFGFLAFMLVIGLLVSLIFKKKNPNEIA